MSSNEMMPVKQEEILPGFGSLQSFEFSQRAAKLLSSSTLVPKDFQNNLPNCVIALNMAHRMGADPLMVMQNLYIVHGRPGFSSQFLVATINSCGRFSALRYEWSGEEGKDTWGCRAWAVEKATGERRDGSTITIAMAKKEGWYNKNGSKWQTMPQQMLMYRAASFFVRAYAPELAMGMHTAEELQDIAPVRLDAEPYFDMPVDAPAEPESSLEAEFMASQVETEQPATDLFTGGEPVAD